MALDDSGTGSGRDNAAVIEAVREAISAPSAENDLMTLIRSEISRLGYSVGNPAYVPSVMGVLFPDGENFEVSEDDGENEQADLFGTSAAISYNRARRGIVSAWEKHGVKKSTGDEPESGVD